ncbi:MAG: GNAT family N-acetyltransferase [Bacteroidales bacterium]|jgi:ribosomal protein S18 acetylase RimI-like enzyme|nr:GNAT family N-acetyltransferase [Bacteroidales bacterium]
MYTITVFSQEKKLSQKSKDEITNFLHKNLEEYGDSKVDIKRAIGYAQGENKSFGGSIIIAKSGNEIVGIVVLNKTGMAGYIPENILVYIATSSLHRGKGIGKLLMNKTIEISNGDIALHVEANNPALYLYEKIGFTNKYLEMRYIH